MPQATDPSFDFQFSFKFNLHKSLIPVGIADDDYKRLSAVYGIDGKTMRSEVDQIYASNSVKAVKLIEKMDIGKLKNAGNVKIAFLGDSITSDRQSYMNVIRCALADFTNIHIFDFAISGHKSGDLFTALFPNVIAVHADIVHIMIGTNDFRRTGDTFREFHTGPKEFEKNINYITANLVRDGSKLIFSTIPPFSQQKAAKNFEGYRMLFLEKDRNRYNDIIRRAARKHGAIMNEMDKLYAQYTPDELTLIDGIHLNDLGHELMTMGVMRAIVEAL